MSCNAATNLHEAADSGWSGVQDVYVVLLNNVPPTTPVWGVGRAFINYLSSTISHRAVSNIRVTSNPTNVCGTPINILTLVKVKDIFVGVAGLG